MYAGLNQVTGELMAVKVLELVGRSGTAEALQQLQELTQVMVTDGGTGCLHTTRVIGLRNALRHAQLSSPPLLQWTAPSVYCCLLRLSFEVLVANQVPGTAVSD